jgi:hypothetical protein
VPVFVCSIQRLVSIACDGHREASYYSVYVILIVLHIHSICSPVLDYDDDGAAIVLIVLLLVLTICSVISGFLLVILFKMLSDCAVVSELFSSLLRFCCTMPCTDTALLLVLLLLFGNVLLLVAAAASRNIIAAIDNGAVSSLLAFDLAVDLCDMH